MRRFILFIILMFTVMAPALSSAAAREVLIVVTSAERMSTGEPTGLWLEEYAVPYLLFSEAGFKVTVASPKGGRAPIDARSLKDAERFPAWGKAAAQLERTVPLDQVQAGRFDAIFLPGGHGTMFDLPGNARLKYLLADFSASNKVIAAVCHGPAGFVGAKKGDGTPLVAGIKITAFTDAEETAIHLEKTVPFLLESRLRAEGAKFVTGEKWAAHAEVDGKMVTGQNPASSEAVAKAVIQLLK